MVNIMEGKYRRNSASFSKEKNNKVFVSNIDYTCTHQDLKEIFSNVGDVAFVEMLKDNNNKPNGCAIVRFKESNIVEKAVKKMNRHDCKGRKLVVKDERDAPSKDRAPVKDRKRPREDDYEGDNSFSIPNKYGGSTYGLSVQFLESLGIDGPLVNRIFVANLAYDVRKEDLEDLFSIAGKVLEVELVQGDDGKSKGFGFIEFDHPIEAVQAISMLHNQLYKERPLSVQLTRKEKKRKDGPGKLPHGLNSIGMGLGLNGAPLKDIARTIDAGQQQSLLGAMPLGSSNIPSLGLGMSGIGGGLSSGMAGSIASSLNPLMGAGLGSSSINSGMGLLGRPNLMMDSNSGRSLADSASGNTRFGNPSGSSLLGQKNVIQISNLPPDYTWKALQNLCQTYGDVTFSRISSRGEGIIHFDNEISARRAVDMLDQQPFEGRYLETRFI